MIKIPFTYLLVTLTGFAFAFGVNDSAPEGNWLSIVDKRLKLEQEPPSVLILEVKPEMKKSALDKALEKDYHPGFTSLYDEIMQIFQEGEDWSSLRQDLEGHNRILNGKYQQLKNQYLDKQTLSDAEIKNYESELKAYYNQGMDAFQKIITEGQSKEVELRKKERQKLRREKLKSPGIEEVWTEEA